MPIADTKSIIFVNVRRKTMQPIELPFKINDAKQMIVFIGIQASGKTTFFNSVLACHVPTVFIAFDAFPSANLPDL